MSIRGISMHGQIMASIHNMAIDATDITVHKESVSKRRYSLLSIDKRSTIDRNLEAISKRRCSRVKDLSLRAAVGSCGNPY